MRWIRRTFGCFVCFGMLSASPFNARAQTPQILTYQGHLEQSGVDYTGEGEFKFALVNGGGTATYWSNDGSSVAAAEPAAAVAAPVNKGLFTVPLGDGSISNMTAIPPAIFTNSDVRLRIWFGDGDGAFAQLSPDQRLSATGYAFTAANVSNGAITSQSIAPGAVAGGQLAPNAVTASTLEDGSVTTAKLAPQAVTTAALGAGAVAANNLAAGAVTDAAIADGSISQAKLDFSSGYINAKNPPYGAKGDGATDDTTAIQSALNAANAVGGGIVFLPRGNYMIKTHLTIPAQTSLVGVWRAVQAHAENYGTTLLAVENAGASNVSPFLTLQGNNSTLEGVTIYYPNQKAANPPTPYPWAIRGGGGDNITIQNVLMVNPYLGIDLATHGCARHLVRFVFGQPLLVGIAVDQCYDIGRIMDIHFWPFWSQDTNVEAFQAANAVTFDFMRTDWEVVEDVFSWGYNVGARFRASSHGSMNGQMSNVNFDNVDVGLQMIDTQPYAVHISNLNIANAGGGTNHIAIQGLAGNADLNVNGATFWGSLRQPVSWNNSGLLTLSNGRFLSWTPSLPCIDIVTGRAMLQGNYFTDNVGVAIKVEATTDRVMVVGNMLTGNTLALAGPHTSSGSNQP